MVGHGLFTAGAARAAPAFERRETLVMARFELLAPHVMTLGGVSQQVDAGTIVDSAEVTNFIPTPVMRAKDAEAFMALRAVCNEIRANQRLAGRQPDPNVPGYGHSGDWPGFSAAVPTFEDRKW
jgi:hypothetical protein